MTREIKQSDSEPFAAGDVRAYSTNESLLGAELGLGSYRTAWMLCAELRRAMGQPESRRAGPAIHPRCGTERVGQALIRTGIIKKGGAEHSDPTPQFKSYRA